MRMPSQCPACGAGLQVSVVTCQACSTRVEGAFTPCPLCRLGPEDQSLLELFLRCRGNARQMERELGLSYPTVRLRLAELWRRLALDPPGATVVPAPGTVVTERRNVSTRPSPASAGAGKPTAPVRAATSPAASPVVSPATSRAASRSTRPATPAARILLDLREGRITPEEAADRLRRSGRAADAAKGNDTETDGPESRDPAGDDA